MTRYLNAKTRQDAVVIAGMVDALKEIADRWEGNMKNPPKRMIAYLRSASSFIGSAIRKLDKELDDTEIERIFRMAQTTEFRATYTEFGLSNREPGVITYDITEDERDNIVEALVEVRCKYCNGCVKDCKVRDQFFKWDIKPVFEVTNNIHPCQYMSPF